MEKASEALCLILAALAWLFTAALALVVLWFVRGTLVEGSLALGLHKWALAAVDKWTLFLLGLIWLVGALYVQYSYGEASGKSLSLLLVRFARASAVELAILALAWGLGHIF